MSIRYFPPTRTSSVTRASVVPSPGRIHVRMLSGSVHASNTSLGGAAMWRVMVRLVSEPRAVDVVVLLAIGPPCCTPARRGAAGKKVFEGIEPSLPECAIVLEPARRLPERLWFERAVMLASNDRAAQQPRALE